MQTESSQFLTIGDEGLKAFNMSILGDSNDYQWKEFQGSVQLARQFSEPEFLGEKSSCAGFSPSFENDEAGKRGGDSCDDVALRNDRVMV